MGSELLTENEEELNEGVSDEDAPLSISKMLDDCFPYYLSLGMTYEQYWDGEPRLVIAYRKAEDMRSHRKNWEMWMNGRYTYDAIMRLIPSLNMWKPKEPIEYIEEPYPLTRKEYEERIAREERKKQEEIRAKMLAFAQAHSTKKKKEVEEQNNG